MASLSSESNGIVRPAVTVKYTKLFINGEFVDSASGKTFETLDPRIEEVIASVSEAMKEEVDLAVKAARAAFDHGPWPRMSGYERGFILYKFADLVLQHSDELAALETFDNGKPLDMSRTMDLPYCLQILQYFAGSADKIHGPANNSDGLMQRMGLIRCTVVIKSAEQTPLTALYCAHLGCEAGIPLGFLMCFPALVKLPVLP